MENSKGPSSIGNMVYKGKSSLLPPKIPYSGISSSFSDYIPVSAIGRSALQRSIESNLHQRTSSESTIDEPPYWLSDLLDEPDTPVRKGHRRSSSDSLTYFENMKHVAQDDSKFIDTSQMSIWGSQVFDIGTRSSNKNKTWDKAQSSICTDTNRNALVDNREHVESVTRDSEVSIKKLESSNAISANPEPDTRRAKQQYAQRSRVRKLQYIAGLERNIQALHVEGSEFSAEIEFLNQQNLILSMENKALNQRLESLSQEHLIKCLEHDILDREATRLRSLYQQLRSQQPTPSNHTRNRSTDLDQQLAKLSLKQKE